MRDQQCVVCPPQPRPEQSPPSDLQKALTVVFAVSPAEPRHGPSGRRQRKMWHGSERRERAGQARELEKAVASLGRVRPPPPGRKGALKPRGQGANGLVRQGAVACRKVTARVRATGAVELSWVQGLECELQRMRVGLIERQRGRVGGGKEREKGFRRGFSAS